MATVFGPGHGTLGNHRGQEGGELAPVRLARAAGERRCVDLARFVVDRRRQRPHRFDEEARRDGRGPADAERGAHGRNRSHGPVRDQRRVVGRAVRATHLHPAMADVAAESGDDALAPAPEGPRADVTGRRMDVAGGIGPARRDGGLTAPFDPPDESARAGTCAALALVCRASRMRGRAPDRRCADVMEPAPNDGAPAGPSRDGSPFPDGNQLGSRRGHHRWPRRHCPCRPPTSPAAWDRWAPAPAR